MSSAGDEERIVPMRLQRFLSRSGVASRRGSENLMTAGRVRVNGVVVSELGSKVDPLVDHVTVDGREVYLAERPTYLVLNKPAGYLTTMSDPRGRHCVAELVPTDEYPGLFPVGRLDADTTGLLLFTTDGKLAQDLLHPSRHVWKRYVALVEGRPTREQLRRLERGVELDDGPSAPARVRLARADERVAAPVADAAAGRRGETSVVVLEIHEGRKRQVKRMMRAVGHPVLALHRDRFGALELRDVKPGRWRMLTDAELRALQAGRP
jgi:23S rRNA pseudouridine2605 synthase